MSITTEISISETLSIESAFDQFQASQRAHDNAYHPDIVSLGTHRRMTHVTLHLAKYLRVFAASDDAEEYQRVFSDTFIMTTSACNILNLRAASLVQQIDSKLNRDDFLKEYIVSLSVLAKACDAADHIEDYPINRKWKDSVSTFFQLCLARAASLNIDLLQASRNRLKQVESAHGLHFMLGS